MSAFVNNVDQVFFPDLLQNIQVKGQFLKTDMIDKTDVLYVLLISILVLERIHPKAVTCSITKIVNMFSEC